MNGSRSPSQPHAGRKSAAEAAARTNGESSRPRAHSKPDGRVKAEDADEDSTMQDTETANKDDDGAASEAETLIDSPVKRREAEKLAKANAAAADRPARHRIGGLPVPTDDEVDSLVSPVPSTEISVGGATAKSTRKGKKAQDPDRMEVDDDDKENRDGDDDDDDGSDRLSTPRTSESRDSSRSRAASERPSQSPRSPNPRKRKHRASSVGLPNKRQDVDATRRNLRGLHSEEFQGRNGKSSSPNLRNHRRAVSTQSAIMDATADANRKRRSVTQGPTRETKASSKAAWEEGSDGSSEATSHDQTEGKMPRRGIGRSTSTPGRPNGREHKRRVNRYGFTKLAEGCENGNLDQVKLWLEKDPEQLEIAEFAGNKPLQIAALAGNIEVVDYLIEQGCQIDCANQDKDTPLIDAAENGHFDVVKSLLNAGVDPLRQNLKGRTALDVIKDDVEEADQIRSVLRQAIEKWNSNGARQKREEEEEQRHRAGPTKELHFMARTYENLLRLVQINDRNGVREFLLARVPVDNGVIAAAAKTGDSYLVNMLLAEMPEKKRFSKPEKPMLSVIGTSHFDMVKSLTELDQFNPTWIDRKGRTWMEIAEERNGPMVKEEKELLQRLYEEAKRKERQSSSPVTRRGPGSKHRQVQDESDEEESEDEVTPRRVNKRRLMSRRDIRANGKSKSDDDSDEDGSSSDGATNPEQSSDRRASMKPPGSPSSSRRQRTKSFSAHPPAASPGTRRRSSSLRGADEDVLPTVKEAAEEADVKIKAEEKDTLAAEEVPRVEAQRKEEEEKAAAEKRAAEEKAAKEEAERAAEEARRKAEEERLALEAKREREEKERAEAEARQEQERKDREKEEQEKRAHQVSVLAGLPQPIAHVLDSKSPFDYDDASVAEHLTYHFTPIQVLEQDDSDGSSLWVLNAQVAPLLGASGLELLYREGEAGFAGSLADSWATKDVDSADHDRLDFLLANLPQISYSQLAAGAQSFQLMIEKGAEQCRAIAQAHKRLRDHRPPLRYVRLDQVLENLTPALRDAELEVRFDYYKLPPLLASSRMEEQQQQQQQQRGKGSAVVAEDFVALAKKTSQHRRPVPRRYRGSQRVDEAKELAVVGRTKVTVIHEK